MPVQVDFSNEVGYQKNIRMAGRVRFVRNADGWHYAELFIVAAVATIIAIRVYLDLADYPQLGGGRLHIAHMLWGGLLLAVAVLTLLSSLDRRWWSPAAVIGGIGFGAFLDELGKFVTADNDYFFRPTIALIYVVFVLLFLGLRAVQRHRPLSETEYLMNALLAVQEMVLMDLDETEKARAQAYLGRCDPADDRVEPIRGMIASLAAITPPAPGRIRRTTLAARQLYERVIDWPGFRRVLIVFFLLWVLAQAVWVVTVLQAHIWQGDEAGLVLERARALGSVTWGLLTGGLLAGFFVVRGVWRIRRSRLEAYLDFRRSVLVNLLITQVFAFYLADLAALVGVTFDLFILVTLNYMIARERSQREMVMQTAAAHPVSPAPP